MTDSSPSNPPLPSTDCPRCGGRLEPGWTVADCPGCALRLGLLSLLGAGSPPDTDSEAISDPPSSLPVRFLGDYELLDLLAEGAMGQVFRARQAHPRRELAVKVLHRSFLASPRAVRRFRNEVELVASLSHPHILPIYEAGEDGGMRFFGMRLAEGGNLAQALARGDWTPHPGSPDTARQQRIARLMIKVAEAVHHAHLRGVIHRDLKPANILLDAEGEPLVADFGLAKAIDDDSELSVSRELLGTPAYMAPEQLLGSRFSTLSSDIYGLGTILFELLTGHPPFRATTLENLFERIRTAEPELPARGQPPVDRDLALICLKALSKEPARRYETAHALALDLQRWIDHEPVTARAVSPAERLVLWCRRRPLVAALVAALLVAVAAGLAGILWQYGQVQRGSLRLGLTLGELRLEKANALFASDDGLEAIGLLGSHVREIPDDRAAALSLIARLTRLRSLLPASSIVPSGGLADALRWNPDGRHLLVVTVNPETGLREMELWDMHRGVRTGGPETIGLHVGNVEFSPDGRWLFTTFTGRIQLWDGLRLIPTGEPIALGTLTLAASWHPDSTRMAVAEGSQAVILDAPAHRRLHTFPVGEPALTAVFSPDGTQLGVGCSSGEIRIWELQSTSRLTGSVRVNGMVLGLQFSPDNSRLAAVIQPHSSTTPRRTVVLITLPEGQPLATHDFGVMAFSTFNPRGNRLLVTDTAWSARLVDAVSGSEVNPLSRFIVTYPQGFSPDGRWLAGLRDGTDVILLDPQTGSALTDPVHLTQFATDTQFTPDGRLLAIANAQPDVVVWNLDPTEPPVVQLPDTGRCVAISPDGRVLAAGSGSTVGRLLDPLTLLPLSRPLDHPGEVTVADFDAHSRFVVFGTASGDLSVRTLSRPDDPPVILKAAGAIESVDFSPDGTRLAALTQSGRLHVWQTGDGSPVGSDRDVLDSDSSRTPQVRQGTVAFHPDGQRLLVTTERHEASIWNLQDPEVLLRLAHEGPVYEARFSHNGRWVATVSFDHFGCLWDAQSGRRIGPKLQHRQELAALDFSPDDRWLATAGADQVIRLWEVPSGRLHATAAGHPGIVVSLRFSPDGNRLGSLGKDGTLRIWSVPSGLAMDAPVSDLGSLPRGLAWTPDGRRIAIAPTTGPIRILGVPYSSRATPPWLADLAEAIAGRARNENPALTLLGLRRQLESQSSDGFYETWGRWFFADRTARPRLVPPAGD